MMVINSKLALWEMVYLVTDTEQTPRMITAILVRDEIAYELSCGTTTSWHREKEISVEANVMAKLN